MSEQVKALSKRAEKALEVLEAGGKFRKALETQWGGGEKFIMRLRDAKGQIVKGVGYQTFQELIEARKLISQRPHDSVSSAWPQEWVICTDSAAAATWAY